MIKSSHCICSVAVLCLGYDPKHYDVNGQIPLVMAWWVFNVLAQEAAYFVFVSVGNSVKCVQVQFCAQFYSSTVV